MRLLVVTPYLPYPPASGGQIRTFNLLKYLSKSNEVTLVSLYKYEHERAFVSRLEPYCKKIYLCKRAERPWKLSLILRAVFSLKPFLVVRNYSSEAEKVLKKLLKTEDFDVIHAETFYVMPHIPETSIPILLVEQTIEFKVYEHFISNLNVLVRAPLYLDIMKLKYWEKVTWEKASIVAAVSLSDKKIIQEAGLTQDPIVIPNGAGDEMVVDTLPPVTNLHSPKLLFQGNFSWLQNTEAAEYLIDTIYPRLKKVIPHAKVIIAGQHTSKVSKKAGITYVDIPPGEIEKVKKLYHTSTLFIAPIFGPGGTRLKILAAMASGLPIVSTSTGIEGLDVVNGEHVLLANTPAEFVAQIQEVLSDSSEYEYVRKNAYKLILEKYNWKKIAQQLEEAYKRIIAIEKKKLS